MKKNILLSLLILSSSFMHAMEKKSATSTSSFSSHLHHFPALLHSKRTKEPEFISYVRERKKFFEKDFLLTNDKKIKKQLKLKQPLDQKLFGMSNNTIGHSLEFFRYCYYQKLHEHLNINLCDVKNLNFCNDSHMNGFSVFGAAIIAQDVSIEKKHMFIQELISHGLKPQPYDKELAMLILYDNTVKHQKTYLHLSHTKPKASWFVLPQEIRTQIIHYMLQLLRKEFWLLPETEAIDL